MSRKGLVKANQFHEECKVDREIGIVQLRQRLKITEDLSFQERQ